MVSFTSLIQGSDHEKTLAITCKPWETETVMKIIREREVFADINICFYNVEGKYSGKSM